MTPWKLLFAGLLAAAMAASAAAQTNLMHNYQLPADVDGNLQVQVKDALIVINELEQLRLAGLSATPLSETQQTYYWDTNNDSLVTNRDALVVVNSLARTVPEPSTLISGAIGLLIFAAYGLAQGAPVGPGGRFDRSRRFGA